MEPAGEGHEREGHDTMIRILSAALATALLFATAEQVCAQSSRRRVEPSQRVPDSQTGQSGGFFETSPMDSPTIVKQRDLFTLLFRTGIVFKTRCYYVIYDPCPELRYLLKNQDVVSSLAQRSQTLLNSLLEERGIIEQLEELTVERIRENVRIQRNGGGNGRALEPEAVPPHEHPHEHEPRFPSPRTSRLLLGTAMFAGGGVLSASKNEWPIDEGVIGVGIAAVGLAFVFKELVPEWRGLRIRSSGANMSITW